MTLSNVLSLHVPPSVQAVAITHAAPDQPPKVTIKYQFAPFASEMVPLTQEQTQPVAGRCVAIKINGERCGVSRDFAVRLAREGRGQELDQNSLCGSHTEWLAEGRPTVVFRHAPPTPVRRLRSA